MGRLRKAKKAYKNNEGSPLWWTGSHKQKKRQVSYYFNILIKEWEAKCSVTSILSVMSCVSSSIQVAHITSMPIPKDESRAETIFRKHVQIIEQVTQSAQAINNIFEQLPTKPRKADIVNDFFTC